MMFPLLMNNAFGTLMISDKDGGGDCTKIGNWNPSSKTCVLTTDIFENLEIRSNNLVLDGNNHLVNGNYDSETDSPRTCIFVDAKLGITIKNFEIQNCAIGISFQDTIQSYVIDNVISNNVASGIYMLASNDNIIKNNVVKNNPNGGIAFNGNGNLIEGNSVMDNSDLYLGQELQGVGVSLNAEGSIGNIFRSNEIKGHHIGLYFDGVHSSNTAENNIIENNDRGIDLSTSENFLIQNNIITNNEWGIESHAYAGAGGKNQIISNTISQNKIGAYLLSIGNILNENSFSSNSEVALQFSYDGKISKGNKIVNNNFVDNARNVQGGSGNIFSDDGYGNYYSDFSPYCDDSNSDDVCDVPYPFSTGTVGVIDNAVWKVKDGWKFVSIDLKPTVVLVPEPEPEPQLLEDPKTKSILDFVDPNKDPQYYIERYYNEATYKDWFDKNYPDYTIEEAIGFDSTKKLPEWIRNIFIWYGEDRISEDELLGAIQFLVQQGIIEI